MTDRYQKGMRFLLVKSPGDAWRVETEDRQFKWAKEFCRREPDGAVPGLTGRKGDVEFFIVELPGDRYQKGVGDGS